MRRGAHIHLRNLPQLARTITEVEALVGIPFKPDKQLYVQLRRRLVSVKYLLKSYTSNDSTSQKLANIPPLRFLLASIMLGAFIRLRSHASLVMAKKHLRLFYPAEKLTIKLYPTITRENLQSLEKSIKLREEFQQEHTLAPKILYSKLDHTPPLIVEELIFGGKHKLDDLNVQRTVLEQTLPCLWRFYNKFNVNDCYPSALLQGIDVPESLRKIQGVNTQSATSILWFYRKFEHVFRDDRKLPVGWVHGDCTPDNAILSGANGALLLTDWETLRNDALVADVSSWTTGGSEFSQKLGKRFMHLWEEFVPNNIGPRMPFNDQWAFAFFHTLFGEMQEIRNGSPGRSVSLHSELLKTAEKRLAGYPESRQ